MPEINPPGRRPGRRSPNVGDEGVLAWRELGPSGDGWRGTASNTARAS